MDAIDRCAQVTNNHQKILILMGRNIMREYEIHDKVNLDHIVNAVSFSVYFSLMRAKGQNEKNWLKGITVENIGERSSLPANKGGGFWEKFKL